MSALTESLEFIENWVRQNIPNHPAVMNQGLSREQIEEQIKDLPYKLPKEIYDLYQWRNGGINPFIPHPEAWDLASFSPLEEVTYQPLVISSSEALEDYFVFVLFMVEDLGYFFFCTQEESEVLPIYCNDYPTIDMIGEKPRYSSLTEMMEDLVNELKSRES